MQDPSGTVGGRFAALRPYLSEYQRRLWLGAEAAALGPRGVGVVSDATGVAPTTIRRGRDEIGAASPGAAGRSRRPGAGRKAAEVHDPTLVEAFDALIEPIPPAAVSSPLRWSTRSVRALTAALRESGHPVSDFVVRRILRQAGYSSHQASGVPTGVRDRQFAYINGIAGAALDAGNPVLSVMPARRGSDPAAGPVAAPRSAFEADRATADFTIDVIGLWWRRIGILRYPAATRLLILPERDGSAGFGSAWSRGLASLAAVTGLTVTSCQLPAGIWRWQSTGSPVSFRLEIAVAAGGPERHDAALREVRRAGSATAGRTAAVAGPASGDRARSVAGTGAPDSRAPASVLRHEVNAAWNVTATPRSGPTRR